MLISPAGSPIPDTVLPYPHALEILQKGLNTDQTDQVERYINELIDQAGGEFITSQWLPQNNNWQGTPLQLINDIAASDVSAGRMFAMMVWVTVRNRPERFHFRGERGGILLERLIYSQQET